MSAIDTDQERNHDAFAALIAGKHHDPFSLLGLHRVGKERVVRTLQPDACTVEVVDAQGKHLVDMQRVHADGLFAALMPPRTRRYRLRITSDGQTRDVEDPYRFPPSLGDLDLYLLGEGSDKQIYRKLG